MKKSWWHTSKWHMYWEISISVKSDSLIRLCGLLQWQYMRADQGIWFVKINWRNMELTEDENILENRLEIFWTHCTRSLSNMRTLYTCIKKNQQWIIDFETLITGRIWHLKICKFYLTCMGYLWKRTHVAFGWKIEKKICITGQRLWIMSSS